MGEAAALLFASEGEKIATVNLEGVWLLVKHVAPRMVEAGGGSIVNSASIAAQIVCSSAGYCCSWPATKPVSRPVQCSTMTQAGRR
ncbi:MAG: SDR family NAD(P)-dependent oxidoreductase [Sphingomicrobium sp.]